MPRVLHCLHDIYHWQLQGSSRDKCLCASTRHSSILLPPYFRFKVMHCLCSSVVCWPNQPIQRCGVQLDQLQSVFPTGTPWLRRYRTEVAQQFADQTVAICRQISASHRWARLSHPCVVRIAPYRSPVQLFKQSEHLNSVISTAPVPTVPMSFA